MKLDRVVAKHQWMGRTQAHHMIAQGKVRVAGQVVFQSQTEVDRFDSVTLEETCDGQVHQTLIRAGDRRLYVMLHKPVGILSATSDPVHTTVLDLIDLEGKEHLHLAGRLDRMSSGLVLLTNVGAWSKKITMATEKIPKTYLVETELDLDESVAESFQKGFYFEPEGVWTLPATLIPLGPRKAKVILIEGKHHQIKRMFRKVGNRVVSLHRLQVGALTMPEDLLPGQWREISPESVFIA